MSKFRLEDYQPEECDACGDMVPACNLDDEGLCPSCREEFIRNLSSDESTTH